MNYHFLNASQIAMPGSKLKSNN